MTARLDAVARPGSTLDRGRGRRRHDHPRGLATDDFTLVGPAGFVLSTSRSGWIAIETAACAPGRCTSSRDRRGFYGRHGGDGRPPDPGGRLPRPSGQRRVPRHAPCRARRRRMAARGAAPQPDRRSAARRRAAAPMTATSAPQRPPALLRPRRPGGRRHRRLARDRGADRPRPGGRRRGRRRREPGPPRPDRGRRRHPRARRPGAGRGGRLHDRGRRAPRRGHHRRATGPRRTSSPPSPAAAACRSPPPRRRPGTGAR